MNDDEELSREALFEILENQLQDKHPPETALTLQRLQAAGYEREDCLRLMGYVLADAINAMLASNKPFDLKAYVAALAKLPEFDASAPETK